MFEFEIDTCSANSGEIISSAKNLRPDCESTISCNSFLPSSNSELFIKNSAFLNFIKSLCSWVVFKLKTIIMGCFWNSFFIYWDAFIWNIIRNDHQHDFTIRNDISCWNIS